mmetsp:Transcript_13794/g.58398  ORF Transcript_13794/g.58398 Transcript_13794/m.58398 type:complete len:335 (+) Transcript_13794:60-1064(+)
MAWRGGQMPLRARASPPPVPRERRRIRSCRSPEPPRGSTGSEQDAVGVEHVDVAPLSVVKPPGRGRELPSDPVQHRQCARRPHPHALVPERRLQVPLRVHGDVQLLLVAHHRVHQHHLVKALQDVKVHDAELQPVNVRVVRPPGHQVRVAGPQVAAAARDGARPGSHDLLAPALTRAPVTDGSLQRVRAPSQTNEVPPRGLPQQGGEVLVVGVGEDDGEVAPGVVLDHGDVAEAARPGVGHRDGVRERRAVPVVHVMILDAIVDALAVHQEDLVPPRARHRDLPAVHAEDVNLFGHADQLLERGRVLVAGSLRGHRERGLASGEAKVRLRDVRG